MSRERRIFHRMKDNDKRIALVTGANKGIGRETARQLGLAGVTVLIGARDRARGEEAASALRSQGCDVHPLLLDVTDAASVASAASAVEAKHGRLDVLVNNAGIAKGSKPSEEPLTVMREIYETNVFGVIAVTQAMLPLLRRAPSARVVNVSSSLGSLGLASDPTTLIAQQILLFAYSSSKTSLNAFTVRLAHELRDTPIKVNSACPGYVATDLNQHRGTRTIEQGAAIMIRLATLPPDGPTGGFYNDAGAILW
jgi:NAD(P)-dependent dehydrogenase (short-subunit alcohol dehydrogenase family)